MSLLGIIETLRRNLKTVVVAGCVVLALVVVADGVRLMTASGEHEAAPLKSEISDSKSLEHTVAPAAEHESHAAPLKSEIPDHKSAPHAAVSSEHTAPAAEHAATPTHATAHSPSEASAQEGGFWATSYHIAENVPAFWTLFGFLGCVVLVVVSKTYGHFGVSKREDYYGE